MLNSALKKKKKKKKNLRKMEYPNKISFIRKSPLVKSFRHL